MRLKLGTQLSTNFGGGFQQIPPSTCAKSLPSFSSCRIVCDWLKLYLRRTEDGNVDDDVDSDADILRK